MPFFAWLIGTDGWRMNFHVCLVLGLIPLYLLRRHVADTPRQAKGINAAELAHIEAGQEQGPASAEEKIPVAVRFKAFAGNYRYWLLVFWYLAPASARTGASSPGCPAHPKTARGFSWSEMGWLASLPFVLSIFCKASSGILADKVGRERAYLHVRHAVRRPVRLLRRLGGQQVRFRRPALLLRGFLHHGHPCRLDPPAEPRARLVHVHGLRHHERFRQLVRPGLAPALIGLFITLTGQLSGGLLCLVFTGCGSDAGGCHPRYPEILNKIKSIQTSRSL